MTALQVKVMNEGAAELRHINMQATIGVGFVVLDVSHRFANLSATQSIEAQYTFPVPAAAVLLSIDAEIGSRQLKGLCKANLEAQDDYNDAVIEGESAVLLEQVDSGLYSLNIGHLGPNEEACIHYRYCLPSAWQSGRLRLCLPTCIAPRYGEPIDLEPWQTPLADVFTENHVSFEITLDETLQSAQAASPSHDIQRTGNTITLTRVSNFADRDFVLILNQTITGQLHSAEWKPEDETGWGITCVQVTAPIEEINKQPRRVHFLLDSSGSMSGSSMLLAKQALWSAVSHLTPEEQFSISAFGSNCEHATSAAVFASDTGKAAATRWLRTRQANMGGTEIHKALESCLKRYPKGEAPDFLILTDGEFWDASNVAALANQHGARLFVVGIGATPAAEQIHKMADESGASAEFLTPNEEFTSAMQRMVLRIQYRDRIAIAVDWGAATDWQLPQPCRAWPGERVSLFARTRFTTNVGIAVGNHAPCSVTVQESQHQLLQLGWSRYIDTHASAENFDEALATKSANLGLVNRLTSMVMVDPEHRVVGDDQPVFHQVPHMLTAGWGGGEILFSRRSPILAGEDEVNYTTNNDSTMAAGSELAVSLMITEAIRLLQHHDAEATLDYLSQRLADYFGEPVVAKLNELQRQGFNQQQIIAALIFQTLASKQTQQRYGFFNRRKLKRYMKKQPPSAELLEAVNAAIQLTS